MLRALLEPFFTRYWYSKKGVRIGYFFALFSAIFSTLVWLRRRCYQWGLCKVHKAVKPVIVVGNLAVGGTGKTPVVIHLAHYLKKHGLNPGIVARGYGSSASGICIVNEFQTPNTVGDEPYLIKQKTGCPVIVGANRSEAINRLIDDFNVDVVISDDGLQHYAMGRDLEIVLVDGVRGLGNGFCLPVGPLREPVSRLKEVDYLLVRDGGMQFDRNTHQFTVEPNQLLSVKTLQPMHSLSILEGKTVHAVAGIAVPDRFFKLLRELGARVIEHRFPDHHAFNENDITFDDDCWVVMTEKDAVKCKFFATEQHFALSIAVNIEVTVMQSILKRMYGEV